MNDLTNKPDGATHYDGNFWRHNGNGWESHLFGGWSQLAVAPSGDVRMISDMEQATAEEEALSEKHRDEYVKLLAHGRKEYQPACRVSPLPWEFGAENKKAEKEVLRALFDQGQISIEKYAEDYAKLCSLNKQYTYDELKALVIAVTTEMDKVRPGMYHPNFTELCIMLAAHESLMGEYRVQIGGGPARGLLQIEELTYASVWQHSDTIAETAMRMGMQCDFSQVEQGDRHSIYICRHRIAMDSEPLPRNAFEMAEYAKRIWNGPGEATAEEYYNDYMRVKNA